MIRVIIITILELLLFMHVVVNNNEPRIVERVIRRQTSDIYHIIHFFINNTTASVNCGDRNTYLLNEDRCVKDQELFRGKLTLPFLFLFILSLKSYCMITNQDAVLLFQP